MSHDISQQSLNATICKCLVELGQLLRFTLKPYNSRDFPTMQILYYILPYVNFTAQCHILTSNSLELHLPQETLVPLEAFASQVLAYLVFQSFRAWLHSVFYFCSWNFDDQGNVNKLTNNKNPENKIKKKPQRTRKSMFMVCKKYGREIILSLGSCGSAGK